MLGAYPPAPFQKSEGGEDPKIGMGSAKYASPFQFSVNLRNSGVVDYLCTAERRRAGRLPGDQRQEDVLPGSARLAEPEARAELVGAGAERAGRGLAGAAA
jgi:hypothetical protein